MLKEFLSKNEGKTLEFKENTKNLKGILKSIVAFVNTAGGTIIIGIQDKSKEVVGLLAPLLEEEKLANAVSDSIAPLIIPSMEITSYRNREILILRIPHLAGPYYLKKEGKETGVYIRIGSTNRRADPETLHSLSLFASNKTFDELASTKGSINENYIKLAFERVNKSPNKKQCSMLGIYTDHFGKLMPSIGGIILFDDKRTHVLPDSIIRCACFKGTTKEKIIDSTDILSPLPLAIEEIIAFIERNSKKEAVIGKIRRIDIPQFPGEAVRELVINALVHSDYSLKGVHIQIAIFSDRLEITNPGGLPFGQTMEKAISGYSRLRNRVIGRVFRELHLIEQWGSGLQRVIAICHKMGLKPPSFEEKDTHLRAILYSLKQKKPIHSKHDKHLINFLIKHGTIQTHQAAKLWNLSDRAARTRLSKLKQEGLIVRVSTSAKDPHAVYVLQKNYETSNSSLK